MGLMNRVLEERIESAPAQESVAVLSPSVSVRTHSARDMLNACLEQIDDIPGGVTVPGSLFEFIAQLFNIRKGALLVRDAADDLFKVWAYRDLDPTTQTRLAMARSDVMSLCPGVTASYRPDTAAPLSPFLSFREGRTLETVLLVKLRTRSRLAGVLVVLDSDLIEFDAQSRDMLLAAVSEPLGRKLVEERETLLDRMYNPLLLDTADFRHSVEELAESTDSGPYSMLLMRISLDDLQSLLTDLLPSYSRKRVRADAEATICSLLGGAGDLCIPEPGKIVAGVLLHEQTPVELLVSELEDQLRERIPILPGAFSLDMELRQFPNSSTSLDSLLSTIVPLT